MASPDHQVGALFEALDEGVLMVPSKSIGYFLPFQVAPKYGDKKSSCIQVCKKMSMQAIKRNDWPKYISYPFMKEDFLQTRDADS